MDLRKRRRRKKGTIEQKRAVTRMNPSSVCPRSSCSLSSRAALRLQKTSRSSLTAKFETSGGRAMTVAPPCEAKRSNGKGENALAASSTTPPTSSSSPPPTALTCVSWDIDGTILRANGDVANKLHHRAFSHAWKEVRKQEEAAECEVVQNHFGPLSTFLFPSHQNLLFFLSLLPLSK